MSRRLIRTAVVTAVAVVCTSLTGTTARAASADVVPPSAPHLLYYQGYYCLTLIVGVQRSTDNSTPQSALVYEVFANGQRIGTMADKGTYSGVYDIQHLTQVGQNSLTVKAVDQAGNRSRPSEARFVTGFPC
jgi:hypothetical protein